MVRSPAPPVHVEYTETEFHPNGQAGTKFDDKKQLTFIFHVCFLLAHEHKQTFYITTHRQLDYYNKIKPCVMFYGDTF